MLDELAPWIAIALALALVPVYALSTGQVDRASSADVVSDPDAYLASQTYLPTLNASNGYEDDALTVTHQYVTGTSLVVYVNNTALDPRFVFVNDTVTLTPDATHTVQIEDTSTLHTTGTFDVTAEIEATVREDGANVGAQRFEQTLTVTVE